MQKVFLGGCVLAGLLGCVGMPQQTEQRQGGHGVAAAQAADFPAGGWVTNGHDTHSVIAVGLPADVGPFIYRIYNPPLVDSELVSYGIRVDDMLLTPTSNEGNTAVVEGRNVSIRQRTTGASMPGQWSAYVEGASVPASRQVAWAAFPDRSTLVAAFEDARLLLVGLADTTDCTGEEMQVWVDDVQLKHPDGSAITWRARSSVLTYGRKVSVVVSGQCSQGVAQGSLHYSEQ